MMTRLLAVLMVFAGLITGAFAADTLTKKQMEEAKSFAANNSLFVLYHEVGHLVFDQLQLPVLGREEDAADNFATWMLLNKATPATEQALKDSARGWQLSGLAYDTNLEASDFYDEHSLDQQRAFAIVCMMVGSDSSVFAPVAREYGMSSRRQEKCYYDYGTLKRSLDTTLGRYMYKKGKGTVVDVTYLAASGDLKSSADAFKKSGIFEVVANDLRTSLSISKNINFVAKRCGEANAYYDPDTVSVTFCYELMEDFIKLAANAMPQDTSDPLGKKQNKTKL